MTEARRPLGGSPGLATWIGFDTIAVNLWRRVMAESEKIDQDRRGADEPSPAFGEGQTHFKKAARDLDEKDLSRPASVQLLIREINRLYQEVEALGVYREKFHEADKEREVLLYRLREAQSSNTLFDICLGVGSAIIGLIPAIWDKHPHGWIFFAIFGAFLLLTCFFYKVSLHKVRNREYQHQNDQRSRVDRG